MKSSKNDHSDVKNKWEKIMKLCSFKLIKYCICILTPFALSPLAASSYKEARCGFVILWMSIYWMLEPVDISVTALLPVPLLPLLGILDSGEVTPNYMKEIIMMFMGSVGVAIGIEHCRLHERIALRVLLTLGADTKWLMFGFMSTSMFLSMWIHNTATTAMMLPIIEAIMMELSREIPEEANTYDQAKLKRLHKTLLLSVAYAANCGGTGTLTGTSSNMVFKGFVESLYPGSTEITYASWMAYNVPGMIVAVFAAWLLLQIMYAPWWRSGMSVEENTRIWKVIDSRYKALERMTFHESSVLTLFILLVLLWTFREPKYMRGWADVLASDKKVGDAVPAMLILCLLFLLPAEPWRFHKSPPLLPWKVAQAKMPWGLIILLGGGYAIAAGAQKSGLSTWLGEQLSQLFILPPALVVFLICLFTTSTTEIMSNATVTTILVPVVSYMAVASNINPLYLMLPVAVASSYSFMLPVATGPNALIFSTGLLKISDMAKAGIFMNLITLAIQMTVVHTLGIHLFNLDTFPTWANSTNSSQQV